MPFKEGSFIIARSGKEVTFTVDNGRERRLLETFPCSTADLSGVELGCTRLEKGNTPAEYLLKRLTINSNRIFSYQTPKKPWFTWWKVLVAAQVILVGGLLFVPAPQEPIIPPTRRGNGGTVRCHGTTGIGASCENWGA